MRHLAHLVRADVRQFRWPLLLWSVLVIGDTILMGARPSMSRNLDLYMSSGTLTGLLWWALQIGMLLLVPVVVHAHPAVGTDAFWMTRPLAPSTIFLSKVLLLGAATVLLPCAARLSLMMWHGVPAAQALFVTLDTAIGGAAWLAVLMAGAVVTLNLPRFALLCGAVVLSLALVVTVLIMRAPSGEDDATEAIVVTSTNAPLPPADDPTGGTLFELSIAAGGLALAALQYRTRRRLVSVPAALAGIVLAGLALPHWPFPLLSVRTNTPSWSSRPETLQLRATSAAITMAQQAGWFGTRTIPKIGTVPVVLGGTEPGWETPSVQLLGASLVLDDGRTLVSRRGHQSVVQIDGRSDPPWRDVARQVLSVDQVFGAPITPSEPTIALVLSPQQSGAASELHGRYRGEFGVRLVQWEIAAALPLRAGSVVEDGSYRFAVEELTPGTGMALSVRGREWRATSKFDRKPQIVYRFFIRNAQRTRAMEGYVSEPFGEPSGFTFGLPFTFSSPADPYRFMLRSAFVSFPMYGPKDQPIDWDPAWYANADFVAVRVTDHGMVKRTLEIPAATLIVQK